jgi:hypothetical protein
MFVSSSSKCLTRRHDGLIGIPIARNGTTNIDAYYTERFVELAASGKVQKHQDRFLGFACGE